jgi:hypothetical protein
MKIFGTGIKVRKLNIFILSVYLLEYAIIRIRQSFYEFGAGK